jgi:hypothetical protein
MIVMPSATKVSPESVPTLSTTSPESSLTEPIELFPSQRREGTEIELDVYGQTHLYDESNDLSVRSDISVASVGDVALLNQGGMGLPPKSDPSFYYESSEASESNFSPGHCQSAFDFTPTNLSTMFNIFDASHRKDRRNDDSHSVTNSVNDAVTEVASNIDHSVIIWERKIDLLEREITTLKEIIKADSVTILCLKTDLSALQERESKWIAERSARDVGLSAQQRQSYETTIQQLEAKIQFLSEPRIMIEVSGDGEQLRLENELFASQIVDNETEIRKTRRIMSQIAEENASLSMELADLKTHSDEAVNPLKLEVDSVAGKLAELENKLERGFYCRCNPNREERYVDPSDALDRSDCTRSILGTSVESDDVEVTIAGDIITSTGMLEPAPNQCLNEHNQPSLRVGNDSAFRQRKSDTVEQQCSFCDCLRVVEKD